MRMSDLKFKDNVEVEQMDAIKKLHVIAQKLYHTSKSNYTRENIGCCHPEQSECLFCKEVHFCMDYLLEAFNKLEETDEEIIYVGHGEFGIVFKLKSNPEICMKLYSKGDYKQGMLDVYDYQLETSNPLYPNVLCIKEDEYVVMEYIDGFEFTQLEFYEWVTDSSDLTMSMLDSFFNRLFKDYSQGIIVEDLHNGNLRITGETIKIIDLDTNIKHKDGEPNTYSLSDFAFCYSPYDMELLAPSSQEQHHMDTVKAKAQEILKELIKKNIIKNGLEYIDSTLDENKISTDPLL